MRVHSQNIFLSTIYDYNQPWPKSKENQELSRMVAAATCSTPLRMVPLTSRIGSAIRFATKQITTLRVDMFIKCFLAYFHLESASANWQMYREGNRTVWNNYTFDQKFQKDFCVKFNLCCSAMFSFMLMPTSWHAFSRIGFGTGKFPDHE